MKKQTQFQKRLIAALDAGFSAFEICYALKIPYKVFIDQYAKALEGQGIAFMPGKRKISDDPEYSKFTGVKDCKIMLPDWHTNRHRSLIW